MNLSKDAIKILKLTEKNESISYEEACAAVYASKHSAYTSEELEWMESNKLILVNSEMMPEGWEKVFIRITPNGKAALKAYK